MPKWLSRVPLLGGSSLTEKLAVATGASLGVKLAGAGLGFLLQVVLARVLGADTFGQYVYVLAWINGLVAFAAVGFDTAVMRFAAVLRAQRRWGALRGLIRRSVQVTGGVASAAGLMLAGGASALFLLGWVDPTMHAAFWIAAPLMPLFALIQTQRGVLRGLGHVAVALGPRPILYPLFLMAAVGVAYVAVGRSPAVGVVLALSVAAAAGVLAVQLLILREVRPRGTVTAEPEYHTRNWLSTSAPMAVTTGVQKAMRETDVIIVGAIVGTTAAGIYAIATRLVRLTQYGLQAVNLAGAPMFAELHGQSKHEELQETVFHGAKLTLLLAVPALIVLFVGAPYILRIFGESFVAGTPVLRILAIGELVGVLSGSNGLLMNMAGMQKEMARIVSWTAVLAALILVVTTWAFGLVGAAVGMSIAIAVRNLWLVARVYRGIGVNPTIFSPQAWGGAQGG